MTQREDVRALSAIFEVLDPLDADARARILKTAIEWLDVEVKSAASPSKAPYASKKNERIAREVEDWAVRELRYEFSTAEASAAAEVTTKELNRALDNAPSRFEARPNAMWRLIDRDAKSAGTKSSW